MKAELFPLSGKYYGTEIRLTDDAGITSTFRLWHDPYGEPSERELEIWHDAEPYLLTQAERDGGHYESATSLDVARTIVDALDSPGQNAPP